MESDRDGSSISSLAVQLNQLFLLVLDMFRQQDIRLDKSLSTTRRTVDLFWADIVRTSSTLHLNGRFAGWRPAAAWE